MHRKNSAQVKVKVPSRGLVTRWPSNTADLFKPGDLLRACVVAKNMRFEDGVMANAPGYAKIRFPTLAQTNLLAHWEMDAVETIADKHGNNDLVRLPTTGACRLVPGKFGDALAGDGGHYQLNQPPSSAWDMDGKSFTMAGWFYDEPSSSKWFGIDSQCIFHTPQFRVYVFNKRLCFTVYLDDGVTPFGMEFLHMHPTQLNQGVWYFWQVRFQHGVGTSVRINGVTQSLATALPIVQMAEATDYPEYAQDYGSNEPFVFWPDDIVVDSVSFWDRAISTDESDELYNNGSGTTYPFLFEGGWIFARQGNVVNTPTTPLFAGTGSKLYYIERLYQANPPLYSATLTEIASGAAANKEDRWSGVDFYDKAVFAQKGLTPCYWYDVAKPTVPVAGLPYDETYDGVEAFYNRLLLWRDNRLKWSEVGDMTTWIPVENSAASARLSLASTFVQPAFTDTDRTAPITDWIRVEEPPVGLFAGQWVRLDYILAGVPYYSFYQIREVTPYYNLTEKAVDNIGATPNFVPAGGFNWVYTKTHKGFRPGQMLCKAGDTAHPLTVVDLQGTTTQANVGPFILYLSFTPPTGTDRATLTLTGSCPGLVAGMTISLGPNTDAGKDIYGVWQTETITAGGVTKTLVQVQRTHMGSSCTSSSPYPAVSTFAVLQPWVPLQNDTADAVTFLPGDKLVEWTAVKLDALRLTGALPAGTTVELQYNDVPGHLADTQLVTVDANSAGETYVVGADDNGPIWQVVALGEYAHIFKERSISMVQNVGRASGTFYIRTEVKNEGLLTRHSLVKISNSRVVFLGQRELYDYAGGATPTPVCMQYTRQLFEELDRSRLNEILLVHNLRRNEVWINYPVVGGSKLLVWNYVEDSASVDEYATSLGGLNLMTYCNWTSDPSWNNLSATWEHTAESLTWDGLVGTGLEQSVLIAFGDDSLALHGQAYSRDTQAYECVAETIDFDFGDDSIYKYVDSVQVALQIKESDSVARKIYVQTGTRDNLDSSIRWSAPKELIVSGDGQQPTKVNPGGSGRYVRLRFSSQDADVSWRVAGFTIFARKGASY